MTPARKGDLTSEERVMLQVAAAGTGKHFFFFKLPAYILFILISLSNWLEVYLFVLLCDYLHYLSDTMKSLFFKVSFFSFSFLFFGKKKNTFIKQNTLH